MSLRDTHRYYMALLPERQVASSWLRTEKQAHDKWPQAERIIECTDMPDDEFDALIISHESEETSNAALSGWPGKEPNETEK